jgi:hypothetical protein
MPKALSQLLCPVPDAVSDALQQDPSESLGLSLRRLARQSRWNVLVDWQEGVAKRWGCRHCRRAVTAAGGPAQTGTDDARGRPSLFRSVQWKSFLIAMSEHRAAATTVSGTAVALRIRKPSRGPKPWPVHAHAYTDLHNVTTVRKLGRRGLPVNEMGCSSHPDPGRFRQR